MSSSPTPRPTVNFFTSAILLFGGSFSGTHLTALIAPYSQLHGLVGFLMFPIAFIAGMQLWPWVGTAISNTRLPLIRKNIEQNSSQRSLDIISSFSFVLTSLASSLLAGIILTPPAIQTAVDPSYEILVTAGSLYGILCWVLIQLGYLQQANIYPKD
ncbi:MAG: hypothetical protein F6K11_08650 [Leptolyngbya sp. SIO3F4]|nr:hypothetical protein [Leptolyngbya sp. SIO3F4]